MNNMAVMARDDDDDNHDDNAEGSYLYKREKKEK